MSCELNKIGRTLNYICREPEFESQSSHLSILRVKFVADLTRVTLILQLFNGCHNISPQNTFMWLKSRM
jgi:hypothetical protein